MYLMYLCSNNICSKECIRCYVLGEDTFDRVAEQYAREVATPHERVSITASRSRQREDFARQTWHDAD